MTARALVSVVALAAVGVVFATAPAFAQDELNLIVKPLGHGTLALQFADQTIVVDPVANRDYTGMSEPTVILITDIHPDHWNMEAAAMLMGVRTKVVAPRVVADQWGGIDTVLEHEKFVMVGDIKIEAVPMYNIERGPTDGEYYHPKGRGNGYVLTFGLRRIYISGDTECIPEMRQLKDIDIAFVAMNEPYTMPPSEAAECVKAFKPKVVYPYHYSGSDLDVFTWHLEDTPEVEIKILDWYPRR